jgi:hypothetical protein
MSRIRTQRRVVAAVAIATAWAFSASAVWAASVTPTVISGADNLNKTCAVVMPGTIELKVEPVPDGTYTESDGTLSVDIVKPSTLAGSLNSFDWTSNIAVVGVIVKDGADGANSYDYRPGGSTGDNYLTTPFDGAKGISHISFCYEPLQDYPLAGDLTVSKTVDTAVYDRTVTWEHTKDVNGKASEFFSGAPGQTFNWAWNLTWTKNDTGPTGHRVSGTILVTNGVNLPVDLATLEDNLLDALNAKTNAATVTGGDPAAPFAAQTLAAGGTLSCTYSANPASPDATQNRVDATGSATVPPGYANSGTVFPYSPFDVEPFTYEELLTGSDSAQLVDAYLSIDGTVYASGFASIPGSYTCPAFGAPEYEGDGYHQVVIVNESSLTPTGGTAIEQSATVTIDCVQDVQRPSIQIQNGAPAPTRVVNNGTATWTGSFIIYNASGGNQTIVTLGATTVRLEQTVRGKKTYDANCQVVFPYGNVIQPNGSVVAAYTCTNNWTKGGEYKAGITVASMTNQLGDGRFGPPETWSNSVTYK